MIRRDELKIEKKIVLVIDICSSSEIMEDLLRTQDIVKWRNLLITLKEYLVEKSRELDFIPYKFIGDGWILLFDSEYNGRRLLNFVIDLSKEFEVKFKDLIYPYLEKPPDIDGLTFGMDIQIIRAIYGTIENPVDVTPELISQIQRNRIDTFVTNRVLGGDPAPGNPKNILMLILYPTVRFFQRGQRRMREYSYHNFSVFSEISAFSGCITLSKI